MGKQEYRIVADAYLGYEVQTRKLVKGWFSGEKWSQWKMPETNSHSTLKEAQHYVDTVICLKVYEKGTFPPRQSAKSTTK